MITTLSTSAIDDARPLRSELHRHHSAIDIPAGFVPRTEDAAWQSWRSKTVTLLESGRAALFVHRPQVSGPADGLALVGLLPEDVLVRSVLMGVGVHAELLTLVVVSDARGSGIGAALYEAAATWAQRRGASALHIDTRADNDRGMRFYQRRGARPAFTQLVAPLPLPGA